MALWGFTDLHAHPASHLGFGARENDAEQFGLFWGKPGLDANNPNFASDLPNCNPIHSTVPDGNAIPQVRDNTRATVIDKVGEITGISHEFEGWRSFRGWPQARSSMHQQMHITWIHRAYQGGLRLLFASVTDNQVLSMLWHRYHSAPPPIPDPNHDYESARRQLRFIRELASANSAWMEVVTSSAQARQVIGQNRLAVVLSLEMDSLTVFQMIALKDEFGVRHVTPIHLIDNSVGGVAVYSDLFNTSNHYVNGRFFQVEGHPSVRFKLGHPDYLHYHTNDIFRSGAVEPLPIGDTEYRGLGYPTIEGHRNVHGVDQGRLRMLMQNGFLIDLAHMSEYSQEQTLELAEKYRYPVMNSHTGLRPDDFPVQGSERDMRCSFAGRIAALGGMLGLGTSRDDREIEADPIRTWISHYLDAMEVMGQRGVALGTDINGFAPQIPFSHSSTPVTYPIDLGVRLASAEARPSVRSLNRHRLGDRTFDFTRDGIAHYGMLPDFLQAVHGLLQAEGQDADRLLNQLFNTAEDTIHMWEQVERAAGSINTRVQDGNMEPGAEVGNLYSWWSVARQDNFASTQSEWAGRPGDSISEHEGYVFNRVEGAVFLRQVQGTFPLNLWWHPGRKDNALVADYDGNAQPPASGYQGPILQGYIFPPGIQPIGTIPLYRWHSSAHGDYFTTANPAWAGQAGTVISGHESYEFVRLEGHILAPVTPIFSWWSATRADNMATTNLAWVGLPGYVIDAHGRYDYFRIEGRVFRPENPQPRGTVPLNLWWHPGNEDHVLMSDLDGNRTPPRGDPAYEFMSLQGYIYPPVTPLPPIGAIPLYRWFSATRGDHFTTTDPNWAGHSGQTIAGHDGYEFERLEGYIFPQ